MSPLAAIAAFRRRVRWSAFTAGALQALLVTAVIAVVALLVVRFSGAHLAPTWWWVLLVVPIVGWGIVIARREVMGPRAAAAHLDQRLGLDGLLMCAGENQQLDGPWRSQVDNRLLALPSVMPRLRWGRLLPMPLLAAGLATLTACLPPPPEPRQRRQLPTYQAEVGRLGGELRSLFERGHVPEEVEQELQQKLRELERKVATGEMPEWRDFDELDQRITREQLLQLASETRGQGPGSAASGESKPRSIESLAVAAKALARLGLLDKLPAMHNSALQSVRRPDGTFELGELPFDPADFEALAQAFGDALQGMDFGDLDPAALGLDAAALGDLEALVAGLGREGFGNGGQPGDGPGRGGVNRGPGHAALALSESFEGAAGATMPLPPGKGLPRDWVPVGSERIAPVVAPTTNQGAGAAGAAGTGGATWQLEYAPRHRAVLKRFFGKDGK